MESEWDLVSRPKAFVPDFGDFFPTTSPCLNARINVERYHELGGFQILFDARREDACAANRAFQPRRTNVKVRYVIKMEGATTVAALEAYLFQNNRILLWLMHAHGLIFSLSKP